eukprot:EG_transcript_7859
MNLCHLVLNRRFSSDVQPSAFRGHPAWPRKLQCDHILFGHGGCVNTIHWNEAGSILVSGSDDRKVNLWTFTVAVPRLLQSLPTLHQHNIFDAKFRPYDENVIYTAGADGKVGSVNVSDNPSPRLLYTAYSGLASKIDFQPQSANLFLATFGDGGVRLFDVRRPRASLGPVVFLKDGVTAVQFMPHPTSSLFAIGADDPFLRICDLRKAPLSDSDAPNTDAVVRMYTAPHLLDPAAQQPCYSMRAGKPSVGREIGISGVAWSQNGQYIAANYRGDDIVLFNVHSYNPQTVKGDMEVDASAVVRTFAGRANVQTCAKEVNFCFDDTHLCSGGDCGSLFVWAVHSGALRRRLRADRCVVNCAAPHPTLPLLASSGIDSEIKVWGVGEHLAPDQEDPPAKPPPSTSRSWHQRMAENPPNVTAAEAKRHLGEAEALKLQGNAKVKAKLWDAALNAYRLAVKELHFIAPTVPLAEEQQALRRACQLNQAHCLLHTEQYREVREVCTAVLDGDPHNVKALYRRATALGQLKEFARALVDADLALQLEPSAELQRLRHTLAQQESQRRRRERDVYRAMFGGGGGAGPGRGG